MPDLRRRTRRASHDGRAHPLPVPVTCRLVVRRIRAINYERTGDLFPALRYHAFLTDTTLSTVDADRTHRAHAVIKQTSADLIDGPLANLPSGPRPPDPSTAPAPRRADSHGHAGNQ